MTLALTPEQTLILDAKGGRSFALEFVCTYATAVGASRLIPIASAHIDGCLYHGQVSLDFVKHFIALGAEVAVPTTLNVGSVDLIHASIGSYITGQTTRKDEFELGQMPTRS